MSKPAKGLKVQPSAAPSKSETSKVASSQRKLAQKYGPEATRIKSAAEANPQTGAGAFPTRLFRNDPNDDYEAIKTNLVQTAASQNGSTPFGMATLTDRDVAWLKGKRDAMQRADFEVWLTKMFDLRDPSHVQILERVYPEYFSRRLQKLEDDANLQLRLAKIRLHGGQAMDKDDLLLIYGIQSGQVRVPTQALWRPETAYPIDSVNRGLFNPFVMYTPAKNPSNAAFMDLLKRSASADDKPSPGQLLPGQAGITGPFQPPGAFNFF